MSRQEHITCPVRANALRCPAEPFYSGPDQSYTYATADAEIEQTRRWLRDEGFSPGSRIAFPASRSWLTVRMLFACWRAGVVACPLSTRLPEETLYSHAEDLGAVFISNEETPTQPSTQDAAPARDAEWELQRHAVLLYTSGSTGTPKAACLTLGNLYWNADGSNQNIPVSPGDGWLLSLPLYHVGGLGIVLRCALSGAAVIVAGHTAQPEDLIEDGIVTHLSFVPTQLKRLLRAWKGKAPRSLKAVLLGGGPISGRLVRNALKRRIPLHTTYGLTEMASQVATTRPGSSEDALQTAGHILPYREARISSEGEILVRGRTLFAGYVAGGEVVDSRDDDGWFATGDTGYLDGAGRLVITGRVDNLIISGGENIQPEEIERALANVPGVDRAVVVGVPDAEYGWRPVAFVSPETGAAHAPSRWHDALERVLPRFKRPDRYYPWPSQTEATLKLSRRAFERRARGFRQK